MSMEIRDKHSLVKSFTHAFLMHLALIDKLISCEKSADFLLLINIIRHDRNEVLSIQNGLSSQRDAYFVYQTVPSNTAATSSAKNL